MKIVNEEAIQSCIAENPILPQFEAYLKAWPLANHLKLFGMNPSKIHQLCLKINSSDTQGEEEAGEGPAFMSWKKGELKLYFWLIVYYCFFHQIESWLLTQEDFLFLQSVFTRQSIHHLKYEAYCLSPPHSSLKRQWSEAENRLLQAIVQGRSQTEKRTEWKQSEGFYFRSNAQCRERWTNHLNPGVSKQKWSREEDYVLIKMVQNSCSRWAEVAKEFGGSRTEHMVKNRYNSLVNKWRKTNAKWTNRQIEIKILELIERSIRRSHKPLPTPASLLLPPIEPEGLSQPEDISQAEDSPHSLSPKHSLPTPIQMEQEAVLKMEEDVGSEAEKTEEGEKSSEGDHSQSEFSELCLRLREWKGEQVYEKLGLLDCGEVGRNYYRDEEIRLVIDDVAEKLGCHPEQIDMFFSCEEDHWSAQMDEEE